MTKIDEFNARCKRIGKMVQEQFEKDLDSNTFARQLDSVKNLMWDYKITFKEAQEYVFWRAAGGNILFIPELGETELQVINDIVCAVVD